MIEVKQTVLHDPANGQHGNCLSAVLASLLHVPIEAVPVFSEPGWQRELNQWLSQFGLAYLDVLDFGEFAAALGISGCYTGISGNTQRSADVLHACVALDGRAVFDPHPDNTGLTKVNACGLFIALRPWEAASRATSDVPQT